MNRSFRFVLERVYVVGEGLLIEEKAVALVLTV